MSTNQVEVTRTGGGGWEISRRTDEGFFPMSYEPSRAGGVRAGRRAATLFQARLLVEEA